MEVEEGCRATLWEAKGDPWGLLGDFGVEDNV